MADKIKKNLLGRTVSKSSYQYNDPTSGNLVKKKSRVVFDKNEDVAKSKVRTTTYKPTTTEGKMTTYKKTGASVTIKKAAPTAQPRLKSSDKKEGMADAVRGGRRNAIKLNEARTELKRSPAKYDAAVVKKALDTGRGGKVKRVMKREMMKGRPF